MGTLIYIRDMVRTRKHRNKMKTTLHYDDQRLSYLRNIAVVKCLCSPGIPTITPLWLTVRMGICNKCLPRPALSQQHQREWTIVVGQLNMVSRIKKLLNRLPAIRVLMRAQLLKPWGWHQLPHNRQIPNHAIWFHIFGTKHNPQFILEEPLLPLQHEDWIHYKDNQYWGTAAWKRGAVIDLPPFTHPPQPPLGHPIPPLRQQPTSLPPDETGPPFMMTLSNGNTFRVTGLCAGHRRIPRTKASDTDLWCFI